MALCQVAIYDWSIKGCPVIPGGRTTLQTIAEEVAAGRLKAKPSRVFRFDEIHEAHRMMESGEAKGKMVVVRN
ncbi:zinc-binding dehydrogenase [Streptomyces sp. NPDC057565]|uniref:zinc-binding dehydrogenase n=1 Tax=Streptomyces sp. NPDC057565 TaxID=3346169 RepID=UPI00368A7BA8